MDQTSIIKDVSAAEVDALTSDAKAMGASKLEVIKQSNGLFTVKMTYPSDDEETAPPAA